MLYLLARRLYNSRPRPTIMQVIRVVAEWHRRAVEHVRDKDLETTQADFAVFWKKLNAPKPPVLNLPRHVKTALAVAKDANDHPEAVCYPDKRMRLLIRLCRELAGASPEFKLACRVVANVIRCTVDEAVESLATLVADGVIEVAAEPDHANRVATTYRLATKADAEKPAKC